MHLMWKMGEEQASGMTCIFLAQELDGDGIHEIGKLKGILFCVHV